MVDVMCACRDERSVVPEGSGLGAVPRREDELDTSSRLDMAPCSTLEAIGRSIVSGKRVKRRSRTGRNDPCPCGSGRKYKRCCLDQPAGTNVRVLWDPTSFRMSEIMAAHDPTTFSEQVSAPVDRLRQKAIATVRSGISGRAAAEFLEEYEDELEVAMARLLSRRSRAFWLHVSRRILPKPIEGVSPWTTHLYRTIMNLAILKHGRVADQGKRHFVPGADTFQLADFHYQDLVDIYAVERLAHEYDAAASAYRCVGKGCDLVVSEGRLMAYAPPELDALIESLDVRRSQHGAIFGDVGLWTPDLAEPGDPRSLVAFPRLNTECTEMPPRVAERLAMVPFVSNYHIGSMPLQDLEQMLGIFESHVQQRLGVSARALCGTLWALGCSMLQGMIASGSGKMQPLQRGYQTVQLGERFERAVREIGEMHAYYCDPDGDHDLSQEAIGEVRETICALTYTDADYAEISLRDRSPMKLVSVDDTEGLALFDVSQMPNVLVNAISDVRGASGDVGNIKAGLFESAVRDALAIEPRVEMWECGKELRWEPDVTREIDVSFVVGDTLFVVECKAFGAHPGIDRGDFSAIRTRWDSILGFLEQARTLALGLEHHRVGKNYSLPIDVKRVEYCVVTPTVEWIPESDSSFWLTSDTPRVCTPSELVGVVRNLAAPSFVV